MHFTIVSFGEVNFILSTTKDGVRRPRGNFDSTHLRLDNTGAGVIKINPS